MTVVKVKATGEIVYLEDRTFDEEYGIHCAFLLYGGDISDYEVVEIQITDGV